MKAPDLLNFLLSGEPVSLASWFGEPVSRRVAESCLPDICNRQRMPNVRPQQRFGLRLAEMIARYWCDQDVEMHYGNLAATVELDRDRAQLELCYGHLLIARKLNPAWRYLDAGFAVAAHLLGPEEYFVVLKRHECLLHLPLYETPAAAAGLDSLLKEAGVIRRLRGPGLWRGAVDRQHQDTID
ncbi:hypothetical protein [Thiogranum longum]